MPRTMLSERSCNSCFPTSAAPKSLENPAWYETSPQFLLGIRICLKADVNVPPQNLCSARHYDCLWNSLRHGALIQSLYRHTLLACLRGCAIYLRYKLVYSDDMYSFRPKPIPNSIMVTFGSQYIEVTMRHVNNFYVNFP